MLIVQLLLFIVICIFVGAGAARLGYSGIIWFIAMFVSGPFCLGLITAMPDRRLERRRIDDLAALRLELAEAAAVTIARDTGVPQATIGNLATLRG